MLIHPTLSLSLLLTTAFATPITEIYDATDATIKRDDGPYSDLTITLYDDDKCQGNWWSYWGLASGQYRNLDVNLKEVRWNSIKTSRPLTLFEQLTFLTDYQPGFQGALDDSIPFNCQYPVGAGVKSGDLPENCFKLKFSGKCFNLH